MSALQAALRRDDYELAALRLLAGLVAALDEAAPATREELIALLSTDPRATDRP